MENNFKYLIFFLSVCFQSGCVQEKGETRELASGIDSLTLHRHMKVLAADSLSGRKPFTAGEQLTVDYLQSQFRAFGLEPGNSGSYFQEVPMVLIDGTVVGDLKAKGADKQLSFQSKTDFVLYTQRISERVDIKDSELVFCGYGIVAPEYGWNDYEGIDMKGKTAVVLVNDPGFQSGDSTLFKGDVMTYYGRWTYKYEEAARQGAEAVLIVHQTVPAGYPWFVVQSSWSAGNLVLELPDGNTSKCAANGWITREMAGVLLDASPLRGQDIYKLARERGFKATPLGLGISVSIENSIQKNVSKNVIALLKGSLKPEEYIIYGAHWDHLGVGQSNAVGDSIFNGANDNASGTAALLAIAEAFAKSPAKPERSIVFLSFTAEEQGLLGSEYYAANPIFPVAQTVANINMDGMSGYGAMKDLTVVGFGQSELDDWAGEIAAQKGRYVKADPDPGKGYFFRSDHFNFARVGVPAIFASGDYEHMYKGVDYISQQKEQYLAERYHSPGDNYDKNYQLAGVVNDAELFFILGGKLANSSLWPQWKQGSEFKAIREKSRPH